MDAGDGLTFRRALSVSPFSDGLVAAGIGFSDGDSIAASREELQKLFIQHGSTEMFARVATPRTSPTPNDSTNLSGAVELANLAKRLGIAFNPEFGLFAGYGDALSQPAPDFSDYPEFQIPPGWHLLGLDAMCRTVKEYAATVAHAITETGVEVSVWDVGNEVEFGCAGIAPAPDSSARSAYRSPDGVDPQIGRRSMVDVMRMDPDSRIKWLSQHIWPYVGALLAAFSDGVRSVDPKARISTHMSAFGAIHTPTAMAFWAGMHQAGFRPNELGFSLYPSSPSSKLSSFRRTVQEVTSRFAKDVFVAEFGYPASPMSGDHIFADWNRVEPGYPIDENGQARMLAELIDWGQANGLSGLRPWAPDLCVGIWAPMSLFRLDDRTAIARPALEAFGGTRER